MDLRMVQQLSLAMTNIWGRELTADLHQFLRRRPARPETRLGSWATPGPWRTTGTRPTPLPTDASRVPPIHSSVDDPLSSAFVSCTLQPDPLLI